MTLPQLIQGVLCSVIITAAPSPDLSRRQVKIDSFKFQALAAPAVIGKQRKSNWCWAAAIQMVLNYHGIFVSQERFVQQKFGSLADRPANGLEILRSLNGRFWSIFASRTRVNAWEVDMTLDTKFIDLLSQEQPLIVGLHGSNTEAAGHAYVVTGVEYTLEPSGRGVIVHNLTLRDPWPANPSEQVISWEEFRRRFIFGVGITVQAY